MTPLERASRYVATLPEAISGSGGHHALFRVACVLVNGFDLSDTEAWSILVEYNSRCLPPWSDRELRHKLSEARKVTHCEPAGHLIGNRSNLSCRPEPDKPPRILGRITLREKSVALAESHPVEGRVLQADPEVDSPRTEDSEARRIAVELVKLHRDGAIKGAHDPDARLFAAIIHTFGATYNGRIQR